MAMIQPIMEALRQQVMKIIISFRLVRRIMNRSRSIRPIQGKETSVQMH